MGAVIMYHTILCVGSHSCAVATGAVMVRMFVLWLFMLCLLVVRCGFIYCGCFIVCGLLHTVGYTLCSIHLCCFI